MTTTEQSREIASTYLEAIKIGDVETMDRLQARDCMWWIVGNGNMTREVFMGHVRQMFGAVIKRNMKVTGLTIEGERVAFELEGELTFPDRVYRNTYHNLLVIRDGLIVEGKEYMDTQAVAAAFGSRPEA